MPQQQQQQPMIHQSFQQPQTQTMVPQQMHNTGQPSMIPQPQMVNPIFIFTFVFYLKSELIVYCLI